MKAHCANCGTVTDCEAYSGLCVDCLIKRAQALRPKPPLDVKWRQAGEDKD